MLLYKCSRRTITTIGIAALTAAERRIIMEMENIFYADYNQRIVVNFDGLIVALWNAYLEEGGEGNKISLNNRDFFENSFKNNYDAAWAVALGDWRWTDEYAYFNKDGYLTSFNHWDDENSPIDLERLDISQLIRSVKNFQKKREDKQDVKQAAYDNINISQAIHDALKEI